MQASKVYILLLERKSLKPTQLLHRMHIPTDWYKQIMFTKRIKVKLKKIKYRDLIASDQQSQWVELYLCFLTIFENLG